MKRQDRLFQSVGNPPCNQNRDQQEHEPQYARKYLTSQILRVFSESKLSSELVPIQEPVNKESLPTGKYQISLDIGIPCFFQQRNYQGY